VDSNDQQIGAKIDTNNEFTENSTSAPFPTLIRPLTSFQDPPYFASPPIGRRSSDFLAVKAFFEEDTLHSSNQSSPHTLQSLPDPFHYSASHSKNKPKNQFVFHGKERRLSEHLIKEEPYPSPDHIDRVPTAKDPGLPIEAASNPRELEDPDYLKRLFS